MDSNIKNDKGKPLRPTTLKRRREILDAALECFLENGVEGTSIEQIRNKSGASHGSIYHLFKSKGEIAYTLYVEGMEKFYRNILDAMQLESTSYTKIRAFVQTHFQSIINEPKLVLYTTRLAVSDVVFGDTDHMENVRIDFPQEIYNELKPFIDQGELVNLDSRFYYAAVIGPTAALGRSWIRYPDEFDLMDYLEVISQTAWKSVQNTLPSLTADQLEVSGLSSTEIEIP